MKTTDENRTDVTESNMGTASETPVKKQLTDPLEILADYQRREAEKKEEERRAQEVIFARHGVSGDLVAGVKEYHNGTFKGVAIMVTALSLIMILVSGIICGFNSTPFVFSVAAWAIEGTLLAQENRPNRPMRILARVFYMFPLPMTILVTALGALTSEYVVFVAIAACCVVGVLLTGFGCISYFIYNPYREQKKQIRAAKAEIREIRKEEKREARMKIRLSEEEKRKARRRLVKQERKEKRERENNQLKEFIRRQKDAAGRLMEKTREKADAKTTMKKKTSSEPNPAGHVDTKPAEDPDKVISIKRKA